MKECCAVILGLTHWRPFLFGKHFTVFTDHRALVYLYHMQDTSNMLTRWAIALQNFDFTVKHIPGKLYIVPDTLSRLFGDVNPKLAVNESALASICRNVPNDRPYHSARPRDFEISTQSLDQLEPVQNDRELFASAVSVFPLIDRSRGSRQTAERRIWRVLQIFVVPNRLDGRRTGRRNPPQHESVFLARECTIPLIPPGVFAQA